MPEVILHENYAIREQIGLFKCKLLNWSAPRPIVMANHPLKTCCMLFDLRNVLQDLSELISAICSTADRCCLDKDSYDNDLVTLTGRDRFKWRELYALSTSLAGKAELLPNDLYGEIVGTKCLDPIAAAAVDDIEMQIEEVELPKLEDSEENWKSRDRRVNELLEQLSSIMHNCSVKSRQNSRAALRENNSAEQICSALT